MSDHEHGGDEEFHSHGKLYFSIFLVLCCFTGISIAADLIHLPNRAMLAGIVLAVAVCKALCVMLIFMHLKFERAWKYLLLTPTLILAFTIPFALAPDVGMHYYTQTAPQIREFEAQQAAGGGHGGHGNPGGHDAHPAEAHPAEPEKTH
ncbi:MAG: cytochrome C oxidase subunit IV family protein [Planctomycetes bacterium]|nr:cytochrome C oxidase subunit IV family protein [Planctomycetota bacterium]